MTTAPVPLLTLDQYRERYANEKGYEYWHGKAIKKAMMTPRVHGILQLLIGELFRQAGYVSSAETELRIDPEWEPKPDVTAELNPDLSEPYPTKPVEIVAEILSPTDQMTDVFRKCRLYAGIDIGQILVFDPEERIAWQWSRETINLERVHELRLSNGHTLSVADIWAELDRRLGKQPMEQ